MWGVAGKGGGENGTDQLESFLRGQRGDLRCFWLDPETFFPLCHGKIEGVVAVGILLQAWLCYPNEAAVCRSTCFIVLLEVCLE